MSQPIKSRIYQWITEVRQKIANGGISEADLDQLATIINQQQVRQRLLYIHASTLNIRSQVVATGYHEPVKGSVTEIDPDVDDWPYRSVHDAILDGWQVIRFPDQRTNFDDREIDVLGYEFILQKLEAYDD